MNPGGRAGREIAVMVCRASGSTQCLMGWEVSSFCVFFSVSYTDMHIPTCAKVMEHHYVMGACACFLLSWFFGCTQKALWMSQTKCIQFPCVSFWSACSEYRSQNLFFSIIIFNLSRTKRGCVIWWVYRHGLNLSPAANYISHIKI